jgi:DhnA family fructose-bisphosphate aldolase class Ia
VVFGRNVIQARSPERFLEALQEVVKNGVEPAAAAAKHGLD